MSAEPLMPDARNFDLGDAETETPMPPTLLDDAMIRAVQKHRRQESQIASIQRDLSDFLGENVAANIAQNLVNYMNPKQDESAYPANMPANRTYLTPHNSDDLGLGVNKLKQEMEMDMAHDETRIENDSIDQILIDAVHKHQRKDSRQEFLNLKLHELFDAAQPNSDDDDDENNNNNSNSNSNSNNDNADGVKGTDGQQKAIAEYEKHARGMSLIAENLVDFLSGESTDASDDALSQVNNLMQDMQNISNATNININTNTDTNNTTTTATDTKEHRARSSLDLDLPNNNNNDNNNNSNSNSQQSQAQEITNLRRELAVKSDENLELTEVNRELEFEKLSLLRDIKHLREQKTRLAMEADQTINQLREYLIQYQQFVGLVVANDNKRKQKSKSKSKPKPNPKNGK